MDDNEYYAMMRRQYSLPIKIKKKNSSETQKKHSLMTAGNFSSWKKEYGHEDAEMFMERNLENEDESSIESDGSV